MLGETRRSLCAIVRLGAHPVATSRLHAPSRISGVLVILWAMAGGTYLTLGGANGMQSAVWEPVVEAVVVPQPYAHMIIGGVLLTAGVLGYIGLKFEDNQRSWPRKVSLVSAAICVVWSMYTFVMFMANNVVPPPDDDNFLAFDRALITGMCILRYLLLVKDPHKDPYSDTVELSR